MSTPARSARHPAPSPGRCVVTILSAPGARLGGMVQSCCWGVGGCGRPARPSLHTVSWRRPACLHGGQWGPRSGPLAPVLDDLNELRTPRRSHRDLGWCGDFPSAHSVPSVPLGVHQKQFPVHIHQKQHQLTGPDWPVPACLSRGADLPLRLCSWSVCPFMFQSGTGATSRQRGTAPWAGQPETTVLPARW